MTLDEHVKNLLLLIQKPVEDYFDKHELNDELWAKAYTYALINLVSSFFASLEKETSDHGISIDVLEPFIKDLRLSFEWHSKKIRENIVKP